MDYFKTIKELQTNFLQNPRKNIEDMIKKENEAVEKLPQLEIFKNRPDRLRLFLDFHKEYASLVKKLLQAKLIDGKSFRDDVDSVVNIQRMNELVKIVEEYKNENPATEIISLRMARAYASALEIFWNRLKRIVFFAGLNPKKKHLNIGELNKKMSELETNYDVNLSKIKSLLNSKLRNCVGHESTYFSPPNLVVFLDNKNGNINEIARLTTDEIYELLVKITITIMALVNVENTVIISMIQLLLQLNDDELKLFAETGKFTTEMKNKINV